MENIGQIAVVGTGAVGGYYGGLLQRAGHRVHFLLHSDYDHVRKNGLRVDSVNGDFQLPEVSAYDDPAKMPRCDLAIVALKTTANHLLPEILPHLLGERGVVLTLQNGLGGDAAAARIVGPDRVVGGLCFLCSNKVGPGHIRHLDYGLVTLGEYRPDGQPGGVTPRLEKLAETLREAGIPVQLAGDLPLARWKKLVWNIPFNGMAVVHDALTSDLLKNPETRARCETLMREVAAASAACARPIDSAFLEKMVENTERMTPYAPSMKLDFDRGHPMEIESIYGNPLRAAATVGVSMPETARLRQQLLRMASREGRG